MTFGESLRVVVDLYGGTAASARRVGVRRWTLYRWLKLKTPDNLQVATLERLTSAFPELREILKETKP